jgi:hypothetical protein
VLTEIRPRFIELLKWRLTPPSSGRFPAGCARFQPPLMSNVRPQLVPVVLSRAILFAAVAFAIVLGADALLSLALQSPPVAERQAAFFLTHGVFHAAVLVLSTFGATAGLAALRSRLPSVRTTLGVAAAYGFVTVLAAPGALMLIGILGAVGWLLLGSMAFALGSGLFGRPWQRPTL